MLFDSHAHLNNPQFDEDREELISSLKENKVDLVLNVGADIKTSIESIELADKYDFIYASVGIHPHDVENLEENTIETLRDLALKNKKVVAIGEIGLDYFYENSPREIQKEWFIKQIELANKLKLPIIVHDRDAHQDTFDIIKKYKSDEIGCVIHCYSGSLELAKEYIKMNCYISIPGTVTFKNNVKTLEVARELPLEYLLIETDSPYLTPVPYRGKRNNPSYVQFVADKIAQERGISYESICEITKENAKRLFNIK